MQKPFAIKVNKEDADRIAIAAGVFCWLLCMARFGETEEGLTNCGQVADLVANGLAQWIESGMSLDNFLFASNVDVAYVSKMLGVKNLNELLTKDKLEP